MAIVATRTTPYAEVEFHTATKLYAVQKAGWDSIQPGHDLLDVQTNKTLTDPVGTWELTLTAQRGSDGMDWYERLTQNNLVVIKMGRPPEKTGTVMVGLVDEIRRSKMMGPNGQPARRVLVRGSDFAKVLTRAILQFYPALANDPNLKNNSFYKTTGGWQAMLNFFTGSNVIQGSPDQMIEQAIVRILFRIMNMQFTYWDTKRGMQMVHLANVLRYIMAQTPQIVPFLLTMLNQEGAFWNFIQQASMKPFNELFLDTRGYMPNQTPGVNEPEAEEACIRHHRASFYSYDPALVTYMKDNGISQNPNYVPTFGTDQARVVLYLRNTPFDPADWNKLYTHYLDYAEVTQEDLGRSDQSNYNTFMAYNALDVPSAVNLKLIVAPVIDQTNAEQYGMNPMDVSIEGISVDNSKLNDGIAASQALSQKLYNWYHNNKNFVEGSIVVKGNPFYKVGQRICLMRCVIDPSNPTGPLKDLYFYIEGVQQNFTVMEGWQTTLTLTRGQLWQASTQAPPASAPKPTPQAPTPPPPNNTHYTVKEGDDLWSIAHSKYGSGLKWTVIWQANKKALIARDARNRTDPGHWIYAGQVLIIPNV